VKEVDPMKTEETKHYQTMQIWIKKGHQLFDYCQLMCENAKNLYNVSNFYYRQVFTALTNDKEIHPLQQEVLDTLTQHINGMNETQMQAYQKRLQREQTKPKSERKDNQPNLFVLPTKEKPYLQYHFLDALFKAMKQVDYRSLPTQSSQQVMKTMFQNWKSFFSALRDYRENPSKYKGKPRMPKYCSSKVKEVVLTNQDCTFKEGKKLKFPKTKVSLNLGKIAKVDGKLKQVRIIPKYGRFMIEVVFERTIPEIGITEPKRYMGIDLGLQNLAAIVTNTDMAPVLIRGNKVKAINQYYNKKKAYYMGILRHGKDPKEGQHTSKRLERLHLNRFIRIKDLFHKVSRQIVNLALQEKVDLIVIGQNQGWKQEVDMGKVNNQIFCSVPHHLLIRMIEYKAKEQGIQVVVQEESYTSKASFLDDDEIPTYGETESPRFSGKRIQRGLYQSANGTKMNADVNGAYNIVRKVVPNAFLADGIVGLGRTFAAAVSTPLVLSVR
jgi:putative transposase